MNYKIDLHTHSIISYDGAITEKQYQKLLESKSLDYIAVTDHNETRFARILQKKLGDKIIVGEEISTKEGDLIGLFLQQTIAPGQSVRDTVAAIHSQGGFVYIPHPFETMRKGLQQSVLEKISKDIDIVEVFNGRARFRGKAREALAFAETKKLAQASSSDAHCSSGVGSSYSIIAGIPTRDTLKKLLTTAMLCRQYAPLLTLLSPAINKIKNKVII
jgi:predicted metal-dependent phosphoesterase TrpH